MNAQEMAKSVVDTMMAKDYFSQWLGIERLEDGPGVSVLRMRIRKEMLNGFGIAHGGITFSLADSALAFASNGRGRHAVSIQTSIAHTAPLVDGDIIEARTEEVHLTHRIGRYRITVTKTDGSVVGLFEGVVYRKTEEWDVSE